ncbi:hypothetical protein [Massilia sp. 9I]|uniref:hypothetical protein n=1 Tax=Massilia sp. 9I TaxID=2653152 RepID=UPI0012F33B2C|nr:hypothetical protein [Massilia sp. 9I]VXB61392.1 conserved hypothetical protein [Massilia sp. 9I]
MSDTKPLAQLVLCIPGPWSDRSELLQRIIAGSKGDYLFAGRLLMHVQTKHVFELEHEAADERMAQAFAAAGPHWRDAPEMAAIGSHRSVVYLLGHGGSDQNVQALMLAAQALLVAGGLGVKVESSGLAHAPQAWRRMCAEFALFSPYNAFVAVVGGRREAYSCSMHTFGMHDVQVFEEDSAEAVEVARTFSWYLYTEHPIIKEGQTFACAPDAPVYVVSAGKGVDYGPDSLFANPYGTWQLRRL